MEGISLVKLDSMRTEPVCFDFMADANYTIEQLVRGEHKTTLSTSVLCLNHSQLDGKNGPQRMESSSIVSQRKIVILAFLLCRWDIETKPSFHILISTCGGSNKEMDEK